jgi:hypothetical protein
VYDDEQTEDQGQGEMEETEAHGSRMDAAEPAEAEAHGSRMDAAEPEALSSEDEPETEAHGSRM